MDKKTMLNEIKRVYKIDTKKKFADRLGISAQNLSNWYKRNTFDPNLIKVKFTDVNMQWLLTGEGEMLTVAEDVPKKNHTKGVPYYNIDFITGFDLIFNDETVRPDYLIDFRQYNHATCWCNVSGHSMEPEITNGDIIALKEIKDKSFILLGEVYAIATTNGLHTIKRLGKARDADHYLLMPANPSQEFGQQEIPVSMIASIFLVLGCVKRL